MLFSLSIRTIEVSNGLLETLSDSLIKQIDPDSLLRCTDCLQSGSGDGHKQRYRMKPAMEDKLMGSLKSGLLTLVLFIVCVLSSNAQKLTEISDPIKVLSRWHGDWERKITMKKSLWIPEKTLKTGVIDSKFILHNKYQESYLKDFDRVTGGILRSSESKEINRYDEVSKKYNKWIFQSDGNTSFWYGDWNESRKTMTWNYLDFSGIGINGKIIEQFKTNMEIETTVVMKDSKGNKLLNIEVTSKAIK